MRIQIVPSVLRLHRSMFCKYYTLMLCAVKDGRFVRLDVGIRKYLNLSRNPRGFENYARESVLRTGVELIDSEGIVLPWRQVEDTVELPVVFLGNSSVSRTVGHDSVAWTRAKEKLVQSEHSLIDELERVLRYDICHDWSVAKLFGDAFTSTEMQTLWEEITGLSVDPANFRKHLSLLVKKGTFTMIPGEKKATATRPAQLFRVSR